APRSCRSRGAPHPRSPPASFPTASQRNVVMCAIGWILQHGRDGCNGRTPPAYLAMAIPARECKAARDKSPHYFGRGPGMQKALKEQCDAFLHLAIWVLGDDTGRITDEASRKLQCQLAAFRFGQQARRQPPANGVQFEFRDRTFQAKQEAAVRCPRVVDA